MKRVVVFAMVLMLGVVSVQAQWSVVPEAGMTVMKAGPMVDWKRIGDIVMTYSPDMYMGIIGGLCRDLLMIRMDMRMITQIR